MGLNIILSRLDITRQGLSQEALKRRERQLKYGTSQQRDGSGTESMPSRLLRKFPFSILFALIAGKFIKPKKDSSKRGSALTHAKGWPEKKAEWMTHHELAQSAERHSSPINTQESERAVKIVGVRLLPRLIDVYNLTVEEEHCYYAEGVLVSNCHDGLQYLAMSVDAGFNSSSSAGRAWPERRGWGGAV
jgi:hypothetical protein